MKVWYWAKCEKCMEVCTIFVSNPSCTAAYLAEWDVQIQYWLERHYGCELKFEHRDDQMDRLWDEGYKSGDKDPANIVLPKHYQEYLTSKALEKSADDLTEDFKKSADKPE